MGKIFLLVVTKIIHLISCRREALLSLTTGKVCFKKSRPKAGFFESRTAAADLHPEPEIFGKAFAV
jgi:hypothetical protein